MSRNKITYSQHPNRAARSAHAKGDKQFRTYDTSAIRPKQSPGAALIGIIVLVVLLVLILIGVFSFVRGCGKTPLVPRGTQVEITITEGEGAKSSLIRMNLSIASTQWERKARCIRARMS